MAGPDSKPRKKRTEKKRLSLRRLGDSLFDLGFEAMEVVSCRKAKDGQCEYIVAFQNPFKKDHQDLELISSKLCVERFSSLIIDFYADRILKREPVPTSEKPATSSKKPVTTSKKPSTSDETKPIKKMKKK